ncbi:MAG TPA: response regulator [Verrucomicrobiae bacterium]|jgi:two-component system alkaline phosphatase synthesis response regulator PhoP|nr:response regulator [Verrucomicrobiae bacterium]
MKKKRILLIDDEVGFTRLLKWNLEQTDDYEVRVENGPEQAVNAAREFQPDVVLLDVIMPRMIGNEVAQRLRADKFFGTTPIIFLSAVGGRKSGEACNGALDQFPFISKPASVEELIDGIERHLPKVPRERTTFPPPRAPASVLRF